MDAEALFAIANVLALAGWVALIGFPQQRWASSVLSAVLIPSMLGAVYLVLLAANLTSLRGGFGSLESVARLFDNRWVLLAGWIHYLAFDLFIGAWQVRDSQRLKIKHRWVVPCLLLTFMFGPLGLVLYFLVRAAARHKLVVDESFQLQT